MLLNVHVVLSLYHFLSLFVSEVLHVPDFLGS